MCLPIRPCQPLRSWQSSLIRNPWPRDFLQLTSLHDRLLHGQARRSSLQDARRTNMRFAASRRTPSRTAHSVAASGAPFEVVHRTAPLSSLCPCLLPQPECICACHAFFRNGPPPVFLNTLPGVHCSNIRADASHMYPPSSKKRPRVWLLVPPLAEAMSFLRSNYLKRNGTTWSCRRLRQPKKARPARGQPEHVRARRCSLDQSQSLQESRVTTGLNGGVRSRKALCSLTSNVNKIFLCATAQATHVRTVDGCCGAHAHITQVTTNTTVLCAPRRPLTPKACAHSHCIQRVRHAHARRSLSFSPS